MELLAIGEVAARSGMAAVRAALLRAAGADRPTRTPGGARRYPRSVLRRLAVIRAARNVGLSLPEIRAALDTLPADRPATTTDWARLSQDWRDRLDEQIAALDRAPGRTDLLHRLRLPVARPVRAVQPGGHGGRDGPGARWLPPALRRRRRRLNPRFVVLALGAPGVMIGRRRRGRSA